MRAIFIALTAISLTALAATTNAEMMLGGYSADGSTAHPLRQFAATAQGSAAPIRVISGPATGLLSPSFAVYEPIEKVIYVSDFFGQAIRVFPAFASGDVAPLRVINPPLLGQTRASAPVPAHDELVVIASNCCIYTFPLLANGNDVPRTRSINWGGLPGSVTELNNPLAITYFPNSDEVAVIDYDIAPPYASKIIFHARTGDGNATPTRVLKSGFTHETAGLAHDPALRRLYLLTRSTSDQLNYAGQIHVFDENANGNDAPLYTIEGAATGLAHVSPSYFTGLGLDRSLQRLMVGVGGNGDASQNRVIVFAQNASGNAAPVQMLSGAMLSAGTIGTPFAAPTDLIFADGFDG